MTKPTLLSLPNELLLLIISYLSPSAPSVTAFHHCPSHTLFFSPNTPLQSLSLVSHRLRTLLLPILFKYSRIELDPHPQYVSVDARLIETMEMQLSALSAHELHVYAKMRSKFKGSGAFAFDESFDEILVNLCRVQESDTVLGAVDNILWFPHLARSFADFAAFVERNGLRPHIKSVVVFTDREYQLADKPGASVPLASAVQETWRRVFDVLDPERVVVAAPPATLAGLVDVQCVMPDLWAFDLHMQYLELGLELADARGDAVETSMSPLIPALRSKLPFPTMEAVHEHMASSSCRPWNTSLLHRRPWTSLAFNEGSSVPVYSTYEFRFKAAPQTLTLLLRRLAAENPSTCPCNIRRLARTAVFPLAASTHSAARALASIPNLLEVQLQLAPGVENDVFENRAKLGRAQAGDLWSEWRAGYAAARNFAMSGRRRGAVLESRNGGVLREMGEGARFVSRDCGERAWEEMVDQALEDKRLSPRWRKVGRGVWEKVE